MEGRPGRPNETCKTLRRKIAAKFRMHFIGSLIKLNRISEVLLHGRFFENFKNHGKLGWYRTKTCKKFEQIQPGLAMPRIIPRSWKDVNDL